MSSDNTSDVFLKIYRERSWPSAGSVSGWGSELRSTGQIIRELPGFLRRFFVRTMLDVPCGDFNWMRHVDLDGIDYIGADVVSDLITTNQAAYGSAHRRFLHLNLLSDSLPDCDLIFCRDCLFHFSHADVFRAFETFAKSRARYLLTTTFTCRTYPRNGNIETGQWTPINLEMAPYDLPAPRALLIEGSNESIVYGSDNVTVPQFDRCLGLWDIDVIRERLRQRNAELGRVS